MISSSEQKKKRPRAFLFLCKHAGGGQSRPPLLPVIPSQSADWRGNPSPQKRKTDCRVATLLAMTTRRCRADGTPSPTRGSTYRPVGRGPRAPPKNAYPAAGHMGPALQVHTPQKNNAAPLAGGAVRQCRLLRRGGGRAEASAPRGCSSPPDAWPRPAPAGRAGRWRGR